MRLFMDASGWVPMAIPHDQSAPRLATVMRMLSGERLDFVTTTWTLYEALAQARRRGWATSVELFERAESLADVVRVDEATESEALRRFLTWRDKSASVVDHANALIAQATRCDAILSFDADFVPLAAAAGLRILR